MRQDKSIYRFDIQKHLIDKANASYSLLFEKRNSKLLIALKFAYSFNILYTIKFVFKITFINNKI